MICARIAVLWLVLVLCFVLSALAEPVFCYAGKPLTEALNDLERRGLRLVYSTYVVRPDMRVEREPQADAAREVLDEILAPHGLEAREAGGRLVVTPAPAAPPEPLAPSSGGEPRWEKPRPIAGTHDEILVSTSYRLYRKEPVTPVSLSREQIGRLPHFGDDLYRTIALLPGVSGGDISAQFALRGGFHSEVLVELDGLELYEPFHFKDAQGLFSILDPDLIGGVDLLPAAFPAEYGDRMAGVVDIRTAAPSRRRWRLGVSLINVWAGRSGLSSGGKGSWTVSARRGYLDDIADSSPGTPEENADEAEPLEYWDVFSRWEHAPRPASSLSARLLLALDALDLTIRDPRDVTDAVSRWGNAYLWLSHTRGVGSRTWVETLAAAGRVDRDRDISSVVVDEAALVLDRRALDTLSLQQDWSFEASDRHFLTGGFELKSYEARYDYTNDLEIASPIAFVRRLPAVGTTRFEGDFTSRNAALHLSDRTRFGRLTVELGGRYDRQSLTGDDQWSPRLNLVVDLKRAGALRFGWGLFHQSQRPHELDVADGETEFFGAERAEHWALGWELLLGKGFTARLDGYRRRISDPRPRFENLFDPFTALPEAESDRIRLAPESARAEGVELFVARSGGERWSGWVSYALSRVRDRVDGRDQPRYLEAREALTVSTSLRLSKKWHLSLVGIYHSGWPTTAVVGELDEAGSLVVDVGPYYAERLPSYRRLDLRASRSRPFKDGTFNFYLDVQNVTNRRNVRGFEIRGESFRIQDDGSVAFHPEVTHWLGLVPTLGVGWSF